MSVKPIFFKSQKAAIKACEKLGINTSEIRTIAQATAAYNKAVSSGKRGATPSFPKDITPDNPANPKPYDPAKDGWGDAIAEAKSERDISKKIDLLEQLSAKQYAAMNVESDAIRKTELMRAWQSTQKGLAYARLAERTSNPSAAKTRRLLDLASNS